MRISDEKAMRRDFTDCVRIRREHAAAKTDTDRAALAQEFEELQDRWRFGPHAEHWIYQVDQYQQAMQFPDAALRAAMSPTGACADPDLLTETQKRSVRHAAQLMLEDPPKQFRAKLNRELGQLIGTQSRRSSQRSVERGR